MARRPAPDKDSVLFVRAAPSRERIYVKDLAKYLDIRATRILRYARKHRLLHQECYREPPHVTPLGAMRIILYIRAWQQSTYEPGGGRQHFEYKAWQRRRVAKKLANPGAATDAEPQRGSRRRA
jgi:hypothetical protein